MEGKRGLWDVSSLCELCIWVCQYMNCDTLTVFACVRKFVHVLCFCTDIISIGPLTEPSRRRLVCVCVDLAYLTWEKNISDLTGSASAPRSGLVWVKVWLSFGRPLRTDPRQNYFHLRELEMTVVTLPIGWMLLPMQVSGVTWATWV